MSEGKTSRVGCVLSVLMSLGLFVGMGGFMFVMSFGLEPLKTGSFKNIKEPDRFDVHKHVKRAVEMAGPGVEYFQTTAQGVRSDGTVDLGASYNPTVMYQFFGEPDEQVPVGAPGGPLVRVVSVVAQNPGWVLVYSRPGERTYNWSQGLEVRESNMALSMFETAKVLPKCSFKELWAKALERGAPADAVASITHNSVGYSFAITGTPHNYTFTHDCELKE